MKIVRNLLQEEEGQDLIEYSLLLAFVALGSAAIFFDSGRHVKRIWEVANLRLDQAEDSL